MSLEIQPLPFYLLIIFQAAQLSLALTPVQNSQSPLQQSFPGWLFRARTKQHQKGRAGNFLLGWAAWAPEEEVVPLESRGAPYCRSTPRRGGKGEKIGTSNQHWLPGSLSGSYSVPVWTLDMVAKEIRQACVIGSYEDWKKRDNPTLPQNTEVQRRHHGFIPGSCPKAAENERGSTSSSSASHSLESHGKCNPLPRGWVNRKPK